MPVVPIRPQAASAQALPSIQPPDPTYLLMAAAQMHKEGRLIQAVPEDEQDRQLFLGPPSIDPGHQEWEAQGLSTMKDTEEHPPKPFGTIIPPDDTEYLRRGFRTPEQSRHDI